MAQLPDMLQYGWGSINLEARQVGAPYNWSLVGTANAHQPLPMPMPRGKVTGGTRAINGQMFIRGAPEDFETWASWGNIEWSYQQVLCGLYQDGPVEQPPVGGSHGGGPSPTRQPTTGQGAALVDLPVQQGHNDVGTGDVQAVCRLSP